MLYFLIGYGIVLLTIIWFFNSPKGKGIIGEWHVNRILKKAALKFGGIEFTDFMFEDQRSSSQIDNMLLTKKALYVVEVKNYGGHIFGNETSQNWTMTVKHVNKKRSKSGKVYKKTHISKHQFYNPIRQNKTHINKINNLTDIQSHVPIFNVVVFGRRAYLRDITHSDASMVLHQRELFDAIKTTESQIQQELSTEQQMSLVDTLYDINIPDKKRRKQHVKDIKKKYNG